MTLTISKMHTRCRNSIKNVTFYSQTSVVTRAAMKHILHLFLLLPLIFASAERYYSEQTWKHAAQYLKQAMNSAAKPCEDFFEHICGNYGSNASNETQFETTLHGKASAVATVLAKAIKGINMTSIKTTKYQKAIKVFYDKCSSVEMDAEWPKRMYEAIARRIGELPLFVQAKYGDSNGTSNEDPWFLIGRTQREMLETAMVQGDVDFVQVGCHKKPRLVIRPEAIMGTFKSSELVEIRGHLIKLAENISMNMDMVVALIEPWMNETWTFINEWSQISSTVGSGERIPLSNLSRVIPNFNWREYLKGVLPDDVRQNLESDLDPVVYVTNKQLLDKIGQLLKNHSAETVKSVLFLRVLYSVQNIYFGPLGSEFEFDVSGETVNARCLGYAMRYLAPAMARLYFDAIGEDILKWRYEILNLGRNIFSAFRFLLNSVDWLDSEDKEKIQKKVDNIVFNPGIPSWIGDEEKIMDRIFVYDTSLDPFENDLIAARKTADRKWNKLIWRNDTKEIKQEPDPSFDVNAVYDPRANEIYMFLGLMVPPLFNLSYPLPVKYGGLGMVIGHELMHAFDADGIYTGISKDHEWLKPEAFREFTKKKNCLVRQYSRYCDRVTGLCVSGEKTIGENIADIDGIKVAYTAYKIVTQVLGTDPPIPGMIHYTDDQIFFLSFARTWCSKGAQIRNYIWSVHTPNKPRVEVAIKNVPLFARAFQCPVGSKYAPTSRGCSLWGELEEPASK